MNVTVTPTQQKSKLAQNLREEFQEVKVENSVIELKTEDPYKVAKRPGVEKVETDDQTIEGVKGKPLEQTALCSLDTRKDAVRALIATIDGYRLVIKETERQWDLKNLRKYNPGIKELKGSVDEEILGVDKSLDPEDNLEHVEIELGEKWEKIYTAMLT